MTGTVARPRARRLASAVAASLALTASLAPAAGAAIDPYRYDETGSRCTGGPQPGAVGLLGWLQAHYKKGSSGGIYNCRDVVGGSSLSLHAEGRAVDYYVPGPAVGNRIVGRLLAADRKGNAHALARRMGVQEIIFNRRIWTTNHPNAGLRPYDGSNPHTDHVHIGLHWGGARERTSFWTGRDPKPHPRFTGKEICGDDYEVRAVRPLRRGGKKADVQGRVVLLHNKAIDRHCVVTVKLRRKGQKTPVSAFIQAKGKPRHADRGRYEYFAGPRFVEGGQCVRWGGSIGKLKFASRRCR